MGSGLPPPSPTTKPDRARLRWRRSGSGDHGCCDKLNELGIKFKVVNVVDLVKLQSTKENDQAISDADFADLFTEDKPVLFAYHSYARDVRGLIYDRPNHDNFNVHGYEEQAPPPPRTTWFA